MTSIETKSSSILGHAVRRTEDPRLITGRGRYVDDVRMAGTLHAAFVRSPMAHARVNGVDLSAALEHPGVAGAFIAADLGLPPRTGFDMVPAEMGRPPLAQGVVRFVGEAVAMVVADTREHAVDGAQLVSLDLEPLEPLLSPRAALSPSAPALFPGRTDNLAARFAFGGEIDPIASAEVTVSATFVNQRVAPVPMEPEVILVVPTNGRLEVWATNQMPFGLRAGLAESLGMEEAAIHVVVPDMGGGFGAKIGARAECVAVAAAAKRLKRPVSWVETRSENLTCMTHGRAQEQSVELGATRAGKVVGLRLRVLADAGAYPNIAVILPFLTGQMSSGVYTIPAISYEANVAATTTTPLGSYRGAGRPEATAMIERAMDMLAVQLQIDPAELRRLNLIPSDAFPYKTAAGATYDSGNYELALDELLRVSDYVRLRADQSARRRRGDRVELGIGLAVYVEVTGEGIGPEWGGVSIDENGLALVRCGTTSFGQGHETSLAQIAAAELGMPFEAVRVVHSDTDAVPQGNGTAGSRSMQHGGSAVMGAARTVRAKARDLAAHIFEASADDIVFEDGTIAVAGVPGRALTWATLAKAARDSSQLPAGMTAGLAAETVFDAPGSYPFGAHCAVAEVDTETGDARLVAFYAVDDCGSVINPLLADGQIHGGIAQGIGQALLEEVRFDADGNPLSASLLDYLIPTIGEIPGIVTERTVTPSPINPLGAKGIGESGTIGSTVAVQNAVIDAIAHLGVRHLDMPLTPERIWNALQAGPAD